MPFLDSGTMMKRMMSKRLAPASSAASTTRLSMRAMRIEDRHDHEDGELMHIGDDDRETGEQQEFERLVDHAECRAAPS